MKIKKIMIALISCAAVAAAGAGLKQLSVPNIEARQTDLFESFDKLSRMDAYVVGNDGAFLGKISKGSARDSLGNKYGAGSEFQTDGLFNGYSKYGSQIGSASAFNSIAQSPPEILVKKDGSTYSIGILTTNSLARTKGQRINPYLLKAWLETP